jgi:ribosome-binding protein aMBF1 (putative translation factor)
VERLLTIFDNAAAQLENLGLSREELAARLRKEDKVL